MHRGLFIRWLILTASIVAASYLIDGIVVDGFFSAFFAAAALGVLNACIRPVLFLLTLPVNVLTFGLFTFVINAFLLKSVSLLIPGFYVEGFFPAVFGSLAISVVNWLLTSFVADSGRVEVIELRRRNGNRWD